MSKIIIEDVHNDGEVAEIIAVRSSLLSNEEVVKMSVFSCSHPPLAEEKAFAETDDGKEYFNILHGVPLWGPNQTPMSLKQQLNHNLTGSNDFRTVCGSCRGLGQICNGQHGIRHELSWPVSHTGFLPRISTILGYVCYFCSRFVAGSSVDSCPTPIDSNNEGGAGGDASQFSSNQSKSFEWRKYQSRLFESIAPKASHSFGSSSKSKNSSSESSRGGGGGSGSGNGSANNNSGGDDDDNDENGIILSGGANGIQFCSSCSMPQPKYIHSDTSIDIQWNINMKSKGVWEPSVELICKVWSLLVDSFRSRRRYQNSLEDESQPSSSSGDTDIESDILAVYNEFVSESESLQHMSSSLSPVDADSDASRKKMVLKIGDILDKLLANLTSTHNIPHNEETADERWLMRAIPMISNRFRSAFMRMPFTCADAFLILSPMRHEDVWRMGLDPATEHPSEMIFRNILVLPKTLHPDVAESSGSDSQRTDPLTKSYTNVMKHSRSVKSMSTITLSKSIAQCGYGAGLLGHSTININTTPLWQIYGIRKMLISYPQSIWQRISDLQYHYACLIDHSVAKKKAAAGNNNATANNNQTSTTGKKSGQQQQGSGNNNNSTSNGIAPPSKKSMAKIHNSAKVGARNSKQHHMHAMILESEKQTTSNTSNNGANGGSSSIATDNTASSTTSKKTATKRRSSALSKSKKNNNVSSIEMPGEVGVSTAASENTINNNSIDSSTLMSMSSLLSQLVSKKQIFKNTDAENGDDDDAVFLRRFELIADPIEMFCYKIFRWWSLSSSPTGSSSSSSLAVTAAPEMSNNNILDQTTFSSPTMPLPSSNKYESAPITKSISGEQGKKTGEIRKNLKGKRGTGARAVLTPNGNLNIDQIGVSRALCLTQTYPIKVTEANIETLTNMVSKGSGIIGGAFMIVTDESASIYIRSVDQQDENDPNKFKSNFETHKSNAHACLGDVTKQRSCTRGGSSSSSQQKSILFQNEMFSVESGDYENIGNMESRVFLKDCSVPFLKLGWFVHVYINDGSYIIMNRQPTQHGASHNTHMLVITDGLCVALSESAMTPYNADCDGDTVTVTVPQSISARANAMFLMPVTNNIVSPGSHGPCFNLNQDSLIGTFLMCQSLFEREHAMRIVGAIRNISPSYIAKMDYVGFLQPNHTGSSGADASKAASIIEEYLKKTQNRIMNPSGGGGNGGNEKFSLPIPCIIKPKPMWSGKQLMELILPSDMSYVIDRSSHDSNRWLNSNGGGSIERTWDHVMNDESIIVIRGGTWVCGNATKEFFKNRNNSVICYLWRHYGRRYVTNVISDWCQMSHAFLSFRGFTCGITDMMLGGVPNKEMILKWSSDQIKLIESIRIVGDGDYNAEKLREQKEAAESSVATLSNIMNGKKKITSFYRYAESQRQMTFDVLDNSFKRVMNFIMKPSVMKHLTFSDLKEVQSELESWAENMLKYCNDMLDSFANRKKNNVLLMQQAGSKGSITNASNMGVTMGLENIAGVPVGYLGFGIHPESRSSTSSRFGEITPMSLGFVKNGLIPGLSEREIFMHNQPARESVAKSGDPKAPGYQRRKIAENIISVSVHADGTVRSGPDEVQQLLFGGDGYKSQCIESIFISKSQLNPNGKSYMSHGSVDAMDYVRRIKSDIVKSVPFQDDDSQWTNNIEFCNRMDSWLTKSVASIWPIWFLHKKGASISDRENCMNDCEYCQQEHDTHSSLVNSVLSSMIYRVQHQMMSREDLKRCGIHSLLNVNTPVKLNFHSHRWLTNFNNHVLPSFCKMLKTSMFEKFGESLTPQHYSEWISKSHPSSSSSSSSSSSPCNSNNDWFVIDDDEMIQSKDDWMSNIWDRIMNFRLEETTDTTTTTTTFKDIIPCTHEQYARMLYDLLDAFKKFGGPSSMSQDIRLSLISTLRFHPWIVMDSHVEENKKSGSSSDRLRFSRSFTAERETSWGLCIHLANKNQISQLFTDLYETYCEGFVDAGEAVGASSTQCVAHPLSQTQMNTFKGNNLSSSQQYTNLSSGVPRIEELLNNTNSKETIRLKPCSITCTLSPQWANNASQANIVSHQMICRYLNQIVSSHNVLWINLKMSRRLQTDQFNNSSVKITGDRQITPHHVLFNTLNTLFKSTSRSYFNNNNNEGNLSNQNVKITSTLPPKQAFIMFTINQSFISTLCGIRNDSDNTGTSQSERQLLECRLNASLLPWQRGALIGGHDFHPECPFYWCLWFIHSNEDPIFSAMHSPLVVNQYWVTHLMKLNELASQLMSNLKITGIYGVDGCLKIESPQKPFNNNNSSNKSKEDSSSVQSPMIEPSHCWTLHLKSRSFKEVLNHPAVIDQYCRTTNCQVFSEIFDIDIDTQQRTYEASIVFHEDGDLYVQPRHMQLISDCMASTGVVLSLSRHGHAQRQKSFLEEVGFEQTSANIFDSAMRGKFDDMTHATPNILFCKRMAYNGIGIAEIIPPTAIADNGKSSIDYNLVEVSNPNEDALSYIDHICSK